MRPLKVPSRPQAPLYFRAGDNFTKADADALYVPIPVGATAAKVQWGTTPPSGAPSSGVGTIYIQY